jgi:hypothetical protein
MGIAGGLSRLEGAVLSSGFLGSVSQTGILPGRGLSVPSFPLQACRNSHCAPRRSDIAPTDTLGVLDVDTEHILPDSPLSSDDEELLTTFSAEGQTC